MLSDPVRMLFRHSSVALASCLLLVLLVVRDRAGRQEETQVVFKKKAFYFTQILQKKGTNDKCITKVLGP